MQFSRQITELSGPFAQPFVSACDSNLSSNMSPDSISGATPGGAVEKIKDTFARHRETLEEMRDTLATLAEAHEEIRAGLSDDSEMAPAAATIDACIRDLAKSLSALHRTVMEISGVTVLNTKIIRAQEKERKKIANEVHDGPAQSLANVAMQMDYLTTVIDRNPSQAAAEIELMKGVIRSSLGEVRKFIFDLRPMTLDDLGLIPTVKRFVENSATQSRLDVKLDMKGQGLRLPSEVETSIFRIIQEAVNNARKHASPKLIIVRISFQAESLEIRVEDDGCGFDVAGVRRTYGIRESLGLVSMMERAELIGGTLTIDSNAGHGTTVSLKLSLPPALKKGF
ncbi:MAG: hypothetical protein CVV64_02965 [Candidatus Wallbacteria bacterium HGW-Wallbacteria-1]|uniref:Histidine kinase domain-containing protein n=1 Tax=Candidatus Wallbacteria bacterium HGW-Wallbacteria-1 TaxID=2013854 RepID=A0A2N1PTH1_9BACT|nr:MAG: hypothetical protein CVV64_02965 [Candidatus Wallbacteria bacterium HGW-Wallbacteria-1]